MVCNVFYAVIECEEGDAIILCVPEENQVKRTFLVLVICFKI